MTRRRVLLLGGLLGGAVIAAIACNGGVNNPNTVPGYVNVSGTVQDWRNGVPLPGAVVRTLEISPPVQTVADANGNFTLLNIPIDGYLILDVASANTPSAHMETYSPSILVGEAELTGVIAPAVSVQDANSFTGGFGVTSTSGRGVILGRVLTPTNTPIAGVSQFQILPLAFSFGGPYYLSNADTVPAPSLAATSSGGGFVYFNVTPGNISVQAQAAGYSFQPSSGITAPGVWSLVVLGGSGGAGSPTPTPSGSPTPIGQCPTPLDPVTFNSNGNGGGRTVLSMFTSNNGCGTFNSACGCATSTACHQVPPNGKPVAGSGASFMALGGGNGGNALTPTQIYTNIKSTTGVLLSAGTLDITNSWILCRPLGPTASPGALCNPASIHTQVRFNTCADSGYQTLYKWIAAGALND